MSDYLVVAEWCEHCEPAKRRHPTLKSIDADSKEGQKIQKALNLNYVPFIARVDGKKVCLLTEQMKVERCSPR